MALEELFSGAVFEYEEGIEQPEELRGFLAYSGTGKLYVATDDGTIKFVDIRQDVLAEECDQTHSTGAAAASRVLQPTPELQLTVTNFEISRSGTYAAVAGHSLEDPEICEIHVLDLAAARPTLRPLQPPASPSTGSGSSAAPNAVCEATALDPELFGSRPGLRVLQLSWHPAGEGHLAVLTSDNTWRLYNTQRPDLAEQTFELTGLRSSSTLGLGPALAAASTGIDDGSISGGGGFRAGTGGRSAVAFAFGPPAGWEQFAVLFLTGGGQVYSLCPVVPFGCHLPTAALQPLESAAAAAAEEAEEEEEEQQQQRGASLQAATTQAWLQQAFRPVVPPAVAAAALPTLAAGMVQSVPHALDEHVPALAGPLPVSTTTGEQFSLTELASSGADVAQALLLTRYGEGSTALLAATAGGWVGAHLLAGPLVPAWASSTPQCVLGGAGGVAGELQSVRSQVPLAPAAPLPPLLLLDVIELGLPAPPSMSPGTSADCGTTVQLLPDRAAAEAVYVLHPASAYALRLPWLPVLADALVGAGGGKLPAALPAPEVQVLLECSGGGGDGSRAPSGSSGSGGGSGGGPAVGILGGVSVGDPLAGSALIVATADGSPRCLRPKRSAAVAHVGLSSTPAGAGALALGGGKGAGASAAAGGKDREVREQIDRIYAGVLSGPKPADMPKVPPGSPTGTGNPEGQRLLTQSIAALRASHVEFQHQAHHDLMERLGQLQAETAQQRQRAAALQELASRAEAGAARVRARAEHAGAVQTNLSSRLRLLAELHWSLPRPPAAAEQRFALEELPTMEAAARQLEEEVKGLGGRAAAVSRRVRALAEAEGAAKGAAPGPAAAAAAAEPPLPPPAQLRRMREALGGQEALLAASMQRLSVLEGALCQHADAAGLAL